MRERDDARESRIRRSKLSARKKFLFQSLAGDFVRTWTPRARCTCTVCVRIRTHLCGRPLRRGRCTHPATKLYRFFRQSYRSGLISFRINMYESVFWWTWNARRQETAVATRPSAEQLAVRNSTTDVCKTFQRKTDTFNAGTCAWQLVN